MVLFFILDFFCFCFVFFALFVLVLFFDLFCVLLLCCVLFWVCLVWFCLVLFSLVWKLTLKCLWIRYAAFDVCCSGQPAKLTTKMCNLFNALFHGMPSYAVLIGSLKAYYCSQFYLYIKTLWRLLLRFTFFLPPNSKSFFAVAGYIQFMDSRVFFLQSSWIEQAQLKSSDPQLINTDP